MSGGRLFQSYVVWGKKEYLCLFILERGRVYLDLFFIRNNETKTDSAFFCISICFNIKFRI